jgi:topoisomerase-4 subunit B
MLVISTYAGMQDFFQARCEVNKNYDENSIQSLDALTHIRLRSGMYIGRLGDGSHYDDGVYVLLKEVIDNSIDEWLMGNGKRLEIDRISSVRMRVRDYGRGIPLGKVIDCVSRINTGAKYNDDVFQFSVGLNGVGTKAVNALSSSFKVVSYREGRFFEAHFCRGILESSQEGTTSQANGTLIEFEPDPEIFKKWNFEEDHLMRRLWMYAYLNRNLIIRYNHVNIVSKNGLLDLISKEVPQPLYEPFYFTHHTLEFAFSHTNDYGENAFSFVNGQYTSDGGTHLQAFREGLLKAINEYSKHSFQAVDLREGLVSCVLVRVKAPVFESQTKNKLSNPELRVEMSHQVKLAFLEQLYQNPVRANTLIERLNFNEKLRKELATVKKEAKEKQKRVSFKIPKLRDCRYHYNDKTLMGQQSMLFLTEGESAAASLVSTRDPLIQAVYSLRGKPLNVHGLKRDQLYRNEEMYNIMSALNIEDDFEKLRYGKIILATDADVDGLHIRNLLITFFLTYFESLAIRGHLYILETPLFKVRNKESTHYCFNEEEKNLLLKKLSAKGLELTRFKGLGELSPNEFKQFIGEKMKLQKVDIKHLADIKPTLEFYMGKNTPDRKRFIMNNLHVEEV